MKVRGIWTEFTISTTPPWPGCPNLNICMRCGWSTLTGPIAPTWLPRAFSSSPHSCLLHVAVLDRSFKSKQNPKRRSIVWYQWGDEANLKTWFASSIQQFFSFTPARAFILWWNTLTLQPQGSCGTTTVAMAVSALKCPSHKTIVFVDNKIWGSNEVERRILCNCRTHFTSVCSAVLCHRRDWLEVELLFYNCFVLSRISMTGASTLFLKSTTWDEYGTRGGILNETAK